MFGDPSLFAVEVCRESFKAHGVWGRMCLHIQGMAFGDINEPSCCLAHACSELGRLALNVTSLWHESFDSLDGGEVYELLDCALFRDTGQSLTEAQRDWDIYGRHVFLTNWGEQFDRAPKCFVIGNSASVFILWRNDDDTQHQAMLPPETFVEVSASAYEWYKSARQQDVVNREM